MAPAPQPVAGGPAAPRPPPPSAGSVRPKYYAWATLLERTFTVMAMRPLIPTIREIDRQENPASSTSEAFASGYWLAGRCSRRDPSRRRRELQPHHYARAPSAAAQSRHRPSSVFRTSSEKTRGVSRPYPAAQRGFPQKSRLAQEVRALQKNGLRSLLEREFDLDGSVQEAVHGIGCAKIEQANIVAVA